MESINQKVGFDMRNFKTKATKIRNQNPWKIFLEKAVFVNKVPFDKLELDCFGPQMT